MNIIYFSIIFVQTNLKLKKMFDKKELIHKGKELSFLLRHDTEYHFDKNGWREINDLIKNHGYTRQLIETIVETNDKKRYEYNNDKTKIRARQGHSIDVDVELKETVPPNILYHGTSRRFSDSIYRHGLLKGNRQYVHLSEDIETADKVGKRHGGETWIIKIDSKQMYNDGIKFFLSNNGVWLTDNVNVKYFLD